MEAVGTLIFACLTISLKGVSVNVRTEQIMNTDKFICPDDLRALFSAQLSIMYQSEVPKYGTLMTLTAEVNQTVLQHNPALQNELIETSEFERLNQERHGAIRVGTDKELRNLRRLFALFGMFPVGYYDLVPAGVPVHSTAFRPITKHSLQKSPFRLFTSLLRLELIQDEPIRRIAVELLNKREIISPELFKLIEKAEKEGGVLFSDHQKFLDLTIHIFKWHEMATVTESIYQALAKQHKLIADVVGFKGPHINHLTPRTLDIDEVQQLMPQYGITAKATIEGPPKRDCPILLRQTSFQALNESILFLKENSSESETGFHTARFGEIEARGIALTPKGRTLYDVLLLKVKEKFPGEIKSADIQTYYQTLNDVFQKFPDNWLTLITEKLAWFNFYPAKLDSHHTLDKSHAYDLITLIRNDMIKYSPIIYEDFLPVSAAGIFQSNLGNNSTSEYCSDSSRDEFESALGVAVLNEMDLYEKIQTDSISLCESVLGISIRY